MEELIKRLEEKDDEDSKQAVDLLQRAEEVNKTLVERLTFCENLINQFMAGLKNYGLFSQKQ